MQLPFLAALWAKTSRRAGGNRSRGRRLDVATLGLETLEAREVLAVAIVQSTKSGLVSITGDSAANFAVVETIDNQTVVTVTTGVNVVTKSFTGATGLKFSGGSGNDSFINRTALTATASGGGGNDYLEGGSGNDVLAGGDGLDTLVGNGGNDKLSGNNHNDLLIAGAGDDTLSGGSGDDRYAFGEGSLGSEVVDDSSGFNWLDFSEFGAGVVVDLAKTIAQSIGAGDLSLRLVRASAIDGVYGSAFEDWIYGNSLHNTVFGNGGADVISGLNGNDTLDGGEGDDWLYGGAGTDLLIGANGADQYYGGDGFDRFRDNFSLFVDGTSITDVSQGESGVCTILAAIATTIDQDRDWTNFIRDYGNNVYDVYLYNNSGVQYWERTTFDGTWSDEDAQPVVDATGETYEAWVVIATRAALERDGVNWANTRESRWSTWWCYTEEGLQTFYGGNPTYTLMTNGSAQDLAAKLQSGPVVAGTKSSSGTTVGTSNIIGDHAYAVLSMSQRNGTWYVQLYNPWGVDGYDSRTGEYIAMTGANDGIIELAWSSFTANFSEYAYR